MSTKEYHHYLKKKKFSEKTIACHHKNMGFFRQWAEDNGHTDPARLRYIDLLEYLRHEKEKGIAAVTVNIRLNSLRHWYESLKETGEIETNPAKRLKLKNTTKTVVKNALSWAEMEELFEAYAKEKSYRVESNAHPHQRNIALLGILIEQAVQASEIPILQASHVNLKKGTLTIPASHKGAERELKLAPHQILVLHNYLTVTRPILLKTLGPYEREAAETKETLFPGDSRNYLQHFKLSLRKINPRLKDTHQIRNSTILQWVKMYGLRQVQYMAGHKQVSTTERYTRQDTDNLRDKLIKYHPFG